MTHALLWLDNLAAARARYLATIDNATTLFILGMALVAFVLLMLGVTGK